MPTPEVDGVEHSGAGGSSLTPLGRSLSTENRGNQTSDTRVLQRVEDHLAVGPVPQNPEVAHLPKMVRSSRYARAKHLRYVAHAQFFGLQQRVHDPQALPIRKGPEEKLGLGKVVVGGRCGAHASHDLGIELGDLADVSSSGAGFNRVARVHV